MTIKIEINEKILKEVDQAAEILRKSRADFVEYALNEAIVKVNKKLEISEKERKTVEAYRKFPQQPEEYEIWQNEQVWED